MRFRFGPAFLFIYALGYLHFLSVFRGSMLEWIDLFTMLVYVFLIVFGRFMFVKVKVDL